MRSNYDGNIRYFLVSRLKDRDNLTSGWQRLPLVVVMKNPEDLKDVLLFKVTEKRWEDGSWSKGLPCLESKGGYRLLLSRKPIIDETVGYSAYDSNVKTNREKK